MNTLIVYATKYGTTQTCAEKIHAHIEADIRPISTINQVILSDYDRIIIGSSVYIGRIRRPMIKFIKKNQAELLKKSLHLFLCSGDSKDFSELMGPIAKKAEQKVHFGSEIKASEMNWFDRYVMKKVSGELKDTSSLNDDAIDAFIKKLS